MLSCAAVLTLDSSTLPSYAMLKMTPERTCWRVRFSLVCEVVLACCVVYLSSNAYCSCNVMSCMFMNTHVFEMADYCVVGCVAWVRAMADYPLLSDAANDI